MKKLWQVIDREMRRESLTARQMAARIHMDPAHLSRLRTGHLRDLSAESLAQIIAGLGTTPAMQTELLTAYLSDKLDGSRLHMAEAAQKVTDGLTIAEDAAGYRTAAAPGVTQACERTGLNRRVAAALGHLADHAIGNRRLQMLLISLAEFARKP